MVEGPALWISQVDIESPEAIIPLGAKDESMAFLMPEDTLLTDKIFITGRDP